MYIHTYMYVKARCSWNNNTELKNEKKEEYETFNLLLYRCKHTQTFVHKRKSTCAYMHTAIDSTYIYKHTYIYI